MGIDIEDFDKNWPQGHHDHEIQNMGELNAS
jgi:hypothetical protein